MAEAAVETQQAPQVERPKLKGVAGSVAELVGNTPMVRPRMGTIGRAGYNTCIPMSLCYVTHSCHVTLPWH